MIRHLTPSDYTEMPWANGKGVTVEMLKVMEGSSVKWRLSRASVVEAGEFSLFAGIERNLTVISGSGFDLIGKDLHLPARPLQPVAFAGDVPIKAENVQSPSDDFNVMTARTLPSPEVAVITGNAVLTQGSTLALFALEAAKVNGQQVGRHDLILTDQSARVEGRIIAVRLFG